MNVNSHVLLSQVWLSRILALIEIKYVGHGKFVQKMFSQINIEYMNVYSHVLLSQTSLSRIIALIEIKSAGHGKFGQK
jgi:hypothetical protein